MKIGLLIFIGLLIIQAKWKTYWNFLMIGVCWGGNPVPFSRKVRPFIISAIISILLVGLFTAVLLDFSFKSFAVMWLVELAADIIFGIFLWLCTLYWNLRGYFQDLKDKKTKQNKGV